MKPNKMNLFFLVLILSLVGNAGADYALLWFAINKYNMNATSDQSISFFYIGQAIGGIVFAQILAVLFDKFKKRNGSIILDTLYALNLLLILFFFKINILSPFAILLSTSLLTGLSTVHRSAVGYALIQKISDESTANLNVAKFTSALAVSQLLGAGISGIIYSTIGFEGCIWLGILTFIPPIIAYFKIFDPNEEINKKTSISSVFNNFEEGFKAFISDKIIYSLGITVALLNVVSSVIPSMVGISLKNSEYTESFYFSSIISLGIGSGILFNSLFAKNINKFKIRLIIPLSLIPAAIILLLSLIFQGPEVMALFFIAGCIGSSLRNVTTGIIRVKRIPKEMIGRVNTIYSSLLYGGQIIGGIAIIPSYQNNIQVGTTMVLIVFFLTGITSYFLLPHKNYNELCA